MKIWKRELSPRLTQIGLVANAEPRGGTRTVNMFSFTTFLVFSLVLKSVRGWKKVLVESDVYP